MNEYSFATFQVGTSNKSAFTAAKGVAENLASLYNPLLIYGRSGLGKTHLLKAIEADVKNENPQAITFYAKCNTLIESLVKEKKNKSTDSFLCSFQSIDLLLIDDLHALFGNWQSRRKSVRLSDHVFTLVIKLCFHRLKIPDGHLLLTGVRANLFLKDSMPTFLDLMPS